MCVCMVGLFSVCVMLFVCLAGLFGWLAGWQAGRLFGCVLMSVCLCVCCVFVVIVALFVFVVCVCWLRVCCVSE